MGREGKKQIKVLIGKLRRQGWTVEVTRGSTHWKAVSPGGDRVNFSFSPSDRNAPKAIMRDLKRVGFDPDAG